MILSIPLQEIHRVITLSESLPEFHQPHQSEIYQERLSKVPHLILLKQIEGKDVAFKVGYERERDGSFYSWMGGVLPEARRMGIARDLAEEQERWAKAQGYQSIRFKTRNRHKNMLLFSIGRGFDLLSVEAFTERAESRIWLEKSL